MTTQAVRDAIRAELHRQCDEADLYLYDEDEARDGLIGVDGPLDINALAERIVAVLSKTGNA